MSAPIINALYMAITRTSGSSAVMFTGRRFDLLTGPDLDHKIDGQVRKGHELVGVYNGTCGIRAVMVDVGATLGRRYGR